MNTESWKTHLDRTTDDRIPKQPAQYKTKGCRDQEKDLGKDKTSV